MQFQKTRPDHLPEIMTIIAEAQAYFRAHGIDQWQNGYPNPEVIQADIEQGESYVVVNEQGQVIATAALKFGVDPNYMKIYEGAWKTSGDYGALHRIAVSDHYKGKGVAGFIIDEMANVCQNRKIFSIKVDTHRDNSSMQTLLKKNGFEYCGQIYLADGSPRMAFERVLQDKKKRG